MTKRAKGFSLIELIVVMAILGILGTIGYMNLPRDRYAVNQAAEGLMRDVQYARFQAITRNTFVAMNFEATGYQIYESNRTGTTVGQMVKNVSFADSRTPRVTIAAGSIPPVNVVFDAKCGIRC